MDIEEKDETINELNESLNGLQEQLRASSAKVIKKDDRVPSQ